MNFRFSKSPAKFIFSNSASISKVLPKSSVDNEWFVQMMTVCMSLLLCLYIVFAVIFLCHSVQTVVGRLMFSAQDKNMTGGDYAFFTIAFPQLILNEKPWLLYNLTGLNWDYRKRALYALKQVCDLLFNLHSLN